jgi:apolipoprotein N-acyltransferase
MLQGRFSDRFLFLLPSVTGVLLSMAWPANGFVPLVFIAWVPLLFAEEVWVGDETRRPRKFVFFSSYFGFFIFNLLTTWWVKYASFFGAVAAIFCNALFMALVFLCFHEVRRRGLKGGISYVTLILFWVAFEHLHMDWDLSWPWLTMGNALAGMPILAQWYEFTGVLGGTMWILGVNVTVLFVLFSIISYAQRARMNQRIVVMSSMLILPVLVSLAIYLGFKEVSKPVDVVVVQPNVDPYNEKFSGLSERHQLERILSLADSVVGASADSLPDFIVAPETALPSGMWEEELNDHPQSRRIFDYLSAMPGTNLVIGAATNSLYPDVEKKSPTARRFLDAEIWYDSYNTGLFYGCGSEIQTHHKSKLVPGVEKMPFPAVFKHLEGLAIDLGGMTGSLGMQEIPSVFKDTCKGLTVAPVICYESIYGDYLSQYIRNGAGLIFIITNDGWWDDTPGYRQHQAYARLRAIEFRRSIARSANTGISCFINQKGDVSQATGWWEPNAIRQDINYNDVLTFYAKHGDYLGTISLLGSIVVVVLVIIPRKARSKAI